jgi:hypothetical protein
MPGPRSTPAITPHWACRIARRTQAFALGDASILSSEAFAVPSVEIVHSLEDSSLILQRLCRAVYADTPLRRHADTVVIFGCGSAALSLGACLHRYAVPCV